MKFFFFFGEHVFNSAYLYPAGPHSSAYLHPAGPHDPPQPPYNIPPDPDDPASVGPGDPEGAMGMREWFLLFTNYHISNNAAVILTCFDKGRK